MVIKIVIVVLNFVYFSYSANILAAIPTPSYSHQIAFAAFWKELSLRGHSVTVITTDPVNDPALVKMTEIDIKWSYKYLTNVTNLADSFSLWNLPSSFTNLSLIIADEQLSHASIQNLIHNGDNFDVVLVEYYFPEYLGFAELCKCPKVLIASLDAFAHVHDFLGNPYHPILYPELGTSFYGALNFKERITTTLYSWYLWYFYLYRTYPEKEKLLHKYFNTKVPLMDLLYDIDLMILNVNPVIQRVRAIGPTTINIGGYRAGIEPTEPIPKDLKEFLDGAKNGFIYFSLGSNVKSKELSGQTLNSITGVLSELPYKVLWKFEADVLPGKPDNVKLVKWAPQQQILAHPNIKLFVTQGGLQSMEEGIYSEVPFVVIPFFGDQEQNANLMCTKGIAKIVDRKPYIKKEDLRTAILEVIQNPRYKKAVQNLKRLALDTPMTGLEKAVWWTEYVIRNNGTKHLRNPAADLPTYQYYLLDVIGFLVSVIVLSAWVLIVSLKLSVRWLCQFIGKKSSKAKEE